MLQCRCPGGGQALLGLSVIPSPLATWLPPNRATWWLYVARQVAVKAKYGLWVTSAEHDAIARVLNDCPGEPLPS